MFDLTFKLMIRSILIVLCNDKLPNSIFLSPSVSTGVRLLEDSVIPPHALRGQKAVLRCNYDLEGDNLYSVKWYYNQKEFYRFIPSDNPKVTIFNHHPGVNVNVSRQLVVQ